MENKFLIRWIIFFSIYGFLDFYYFQLIKTLFKRQIFYVLLEITSAAVLIIFIGRYLLAKETVYPASWLQNFSIGFLMAFMFFKLFITIFLVPEDIYRLGSALYTKFFSTENQFIIPSRRKFISQIALGIAAIPFTGLLYGVIRGRYNYTIHKHTLFFDDLPNDFDGYRITQISDIHSGSFDNKKKITYAVNLINEQKSDVILFTGDIVNNHTKELLPWKDTLSKLSAKDGIFSILGNHDYGDYMHWNSSKEKQENQELLYESQKEMGFDLLLNESRYLKKGKSRIALVGVENWGARGFSKHGDLELAQKDIKSNDFKILMSHDPTHWEEKVKHNDYHYHLTLSGHTHGMQFGVEIPGFIKWSPSRWVYKHWAGMYEENNQYLNVNRGLGYIGYPGRFGIWPEVSIIELKKGKNNNFSIIS